VAPIPGTKRLPSGHAGDLLSHFTQGVNAFTALREPPAWLQCGEGII
jgi:hypothetical protein